MIWLDNYNVNYYMSNISPTPSSQVSFNGHVIGISYNPHGSFIQRRMNSKCITPALIDNAIVGVFENGFVDFDIQSQRYFNFSPSFIDKVFNIPLKPKFQRNDYSRIEYFKPITIDEENVNSDIGLLTIMWNISTKHFQNRRGRS